MSVSPRSSLASSNPNAAFSVTSLLSPLDAALASPSYSSSLGDPSSRGISSSSASAAGTPSSGVAAAAVGAVGGGSTTLAPCASVTDFAAVAMQNPYGMNPMAHMAQFGSAASTYQYCNTDLSHYAANPASAAAWYGSSTTDPRFASKSSCLISENISIFGSRIYDFIFKEDNGHACLCSENQSFYHLHD